MNKEHKITEPLTGNYEIVLAFSSHGKGDPRNKSLVHRLVVNGTETSSLFVVTKGDKEFGFYGLSAAIWAYNKESNEHGKS